METFTMRILLAGATGAIGRRLVPELVGRGHEVIGLTRRPERLADLAKLGATAELCDVLLPERVVELAVRYQPEAILNQLTQLPQMPQPRHFLETTAANDRVRREGTRNLLLAARTAGTRLILTQSVAFWYERRGAAVKMEQDPLDLAAAPPLQQSIRTIHEAEGLTLNAGSPRGIVLRYGALYGPGTWYDRNGALAQQVRKRMFPIIGQGEGITSFVHVDDAALATVIALQAERSGIFNIADDEPAAQRIWLPYYARLLGAPPPHHVPTLLARMVAGRSMTDWLTEMRGASNFRARTELGWKPRFSTWRDGFRKELTLLTRSHSAPDL